MQSWTNTEAMKLILQEVDQYIGLHEQPAFLQRFINLPHIAVVHLSKENEAKHGYDVGPVEHLQHHGHLRISMTAHALLPSHSRFQSSMAMV